MKALLIILLFLTHLLMSYGGAISPLLALLGSLLIIVIARAAWPMQWKDWLGLRIGVRDAALAALLAPLLILFLYFTVRAIASAQGILYQPPTARYGILSIKYLHTLGQTLNEEMLLGALLLNAVLRRFDKSHPLLVAGGVALGFAALHYVFYRWIVIPKHSGILTLGTLFVLFAIGLLRNTLILKANHIAYSWSVHLSINITGLIALYTFEDGARLGEAQIFNLILGSQAAALLSVFMLAACGIALLRAKSPEIVES
ncbi:MAG: hypothetical protein JXA78_00985 [Anaerolineales bacterium]|nr:hypothetical protein [Anaerolineales bacterium]